MKTGGLILFIVFLLIEPLSQILEKKGLNQLEITDWRQVLSLEFILRALSNPYFGAGLVLAGIGLVIWLILISQFKMTYIYPLGSLMYVVMIGLSVFWLHESVSIVRLVGIGVIMLGVVLVNL